VADLAGDTPEGSALYRIGWGDEPWEWPDWSYAGPDGTFDGRWDDPQGTYRVLYAASDRVTAFIEVLSRFRLNPAVAAALRQIDAPDDRGIPPGRVPASWVQRRTIGTAIVKGVFADVTHRDSIAHLRTRMAWAIEDFGLEDISAAELKSGHRDFTRAVSRFIYDQTTSDGSAFAGITYRSKHGDELKVWAVFEHASSDYITVLWRGDRIRPDDPDLLTACELLGVELDPNL
jgi:hypothetical protein